MTASSMFGNCLINILTNSSRVLAIVWACLTVQLSVMLFVPPDMITFPGFAGIPPCCARHMMCCSLSPPMPQLMKPGR